MSELLDTTQDNSMQACERICRASLADATARYGRAEDALRVAQQGVQRAQAVLDKIGEERTRLTKSLEALLGPGAEMVRADHAPETPAEPKIAQATPDAPKSVTPSDAPSSDKPDECAAVGLAIKPRRRRAGDGKGVLTKCGAKMNAELRALKLVPKPSPCETQAQVDEWLKACGVKYRAGLPLTPHIVWVVCSLNGQRLLTTGEMGALVAALHIWKAKAHPTAEYNPSSSISCCNEFWRFTGAVGLWECLWIPNDACARALEAALHDASSLAEAG